MTQLSQETRDKLLMAIASGLAAMLTAAADPELDEEERDTLREISAHLNTLVGLMMLETGV